MHFNWSKYTILIAEDDPINYRYVQLLLEKRTGAKILWAKNGVDAYKQIKINSVIDIVLLDYQLPDLNGYEVLVKAKKIRPELPIIMQTAKTWNNEDELCTKAGCDGFFTKPLKIDSLFEHMNKCMLAYSEKKIMEQAL